MTILTIAIIYLLGAALLILGFATKSKLLKILSLISIVASTVQLLMLAMMAL